MPASTAVPAVCSSDHVTVRRPLIAGEAESRRVRVRDGRRWWLPAENLTLATLALWLILLTVIPAQAQSLGTVSNAISGFVGVDVPFSQFNASVETSGIFGTVRILAHSYGQMFAPPLQTGVELAHETGSRGGEIFGRIRYTRASGRDEVRFGERVVGFSTATPGTTTGDIVQVSDYRAWTFEAGARWPIGPPEARIRPVAGLAGGATVVRPITVMPYCGLRTADCAVYERSVVPTVTGLVGLSFRMAPRLDFMVESGLRYEAALHQDPSHLGLGPFVDNIYTGRRWSVPVAGNLRLLF